jgi:hypothetical protein
MKRVTHFCKKGGPRDSRQDITICVSQQVAARAYIKVAVPHVLGRVFIDDLELAARGCCRKSLLAALAAARDTGGNISLDCVVRLTSIFFCASGTSGLMGSNISRGIIFRWIART